MIRIDYGPRFLRALRQIKPNITEEAEKRLLQISQGFGNPHAHGGLGLRKLESRAYEARIGLHYRMILIHQKDCLFAYDVMTHEEVRHWLKSK
jgi:cellobiose-specific phosphotransferase system component IIA